MRKLFFFCLLFSGHGLFAQMSVAHYFTSGMVLQQNKPNTLFGTAEPGAVVSLRFRRLKMATIADKEGNWQLQLPPYKSSEPETITLNSGQEEIVLDNILFGEVWVCSGQSNMEFPMSSFAEYYKEEIQSANNDKIRFVMIERTFTNQERHFPPLSRSWRSVTAKSLPECSAVAYFFAKKLQQETGTPVGLVISAWGGTPAQAWMDTSALKAFPNYYNTYKKSILPLDFSQLEKKQRDADLAFRQKRATATPSATGIAAENYNDNNWLNHTLPGVWENQGFPQLDGIAAYRIRFTVPAGSENEPAEIQLPGVDDVDSTFINGKFIGSFNIWNQPRNYKIEPGILKAGENLLTIWVEDGQGGGGLNNDPAGFYIKLGAKKINLSGAAKFTVLAPKENPVLGVNLFAMQNEPAVLYNGMISPLLRISLRGVIWYQGESNVPRYEEYRTLFPSLITAWRKKWKQGNFPFLFVQLSSYNPGGVEPVLSDWAFLREAQTRALQLPNTGMAVSTDVGDRDDIHPKRKKEVGDRLAAIALNKIYGKKEQPFSGPVFATQTISGEKIALKFSFTGGGLVQQGATLNGFTIAGADKKFVPATAVIAGNTVVVSAETVKAPLYVRYAWANAPLEANLYNKEGFPAVPFRTDK